jgi:hypothetical protein
LHSLPARGRFAGRAGRKRKKVSHGYCGNGNVAYLCTPFRKEVLDADRAERERKKSFLKTLAERELVLTFAAPSERKPRPLTERPREGKKSFERLLAKRESLLTFAAASTGKHLPPTGRGKKKREKKLPRALETRILFLPLQPRPEGREDNKRLSHSSAKG